MNRDASIYVAGHRGLVGSAIVRVLRANGYQNIVTCERTRLDLTLQNEVDNFFSRVRPQFVFLAAAKVGGILANSEEPAAFIRDNLCIQTNVIDAAYRFGCRKLLFMGSSCIYPKLADQPMVEECLLTGSLEPTNQWYAIAKISGLMMAQAYKLQYDFNAISVMPTNIYGPGDNFSLETSHVLPALLRKFHEAKLRCADEVVIWGTGSPRREFLHAEDLADACLHLMLHYDDYRLINIGCGVDLSISDLAGLIGKIVGFHGNIRFDLSKPDGAPRKILNTERLTALGWQPKIELAAGIRSTYAWFSENQEVLRS